MTQEAFVKEKIIGTWKLVSWTYQNAAGETCDYFGDHPRGVLMYDRNGYMNVQIMRDGRKPLSAQAMGSGSAEEVREAYQGYAAYFGRYHERTPGEFVHTVEGSLFPNWTGQEEIRYAHFDGEDLILSTPPMPATTGGTLVFEVRWVRLGK